VEVAGAVAVEEEAVAVAVVMAVVAVSEAKREQMIILALNLIQSVHVLFVALVSK
jgi:hypothetical protein